MNPKMVEVLGNLALKVLEQSMRQEAASGGHGRQQQFPVQPLLDWNAGTPPVFNPVCFNPAFDPSGFYAAPDFGWNGSPWPFC